MSRVYVTTYEIVGAGVERAKEYYARFDAAREAQWAFAESVGGSGLRPDHNGGVRSIFFAGDLPPGWRKIGREGDKIEAVPSRSSKAGKEVEKQFAGAPRVPRTSDLAEAFGYAPNEMAMDGERGVIYFPTELRVLKPTERFFLRLPRFDRDGFTPDGAVLRAIPESELMKAVEDHNADAKRQRTRAAA